MLYTLFLNSTGVSTDTRTLEKGNLFIALSGDNFNGNDHIEAAFAKDASHVISDDLSFQNQSHVTVVTNTLTFLQELALHHREVLNIPIVALTGSNGKTTTKELILAVLSQKYQVKGTKGNLNNHIGVPLTLLSFNKSTEIGIVEMGANHQQEIAALARIAKPDYGLITNFGKAHLEGFGGLEGVIKGKSELYDYLRQNHGKAIIGLWDTLQQERSQQIEQISTPTDTTLLDNGTYMSFTVNGKTAHTQLTGAYNYHNALLAYTVGTVFKVSEDAILEGITNYTPTNHRSQIIKEGALQIIMDSYNANPSSMEVAIANLASKDMPYKIAILGDMFELGDYAAQEHQRITAMAEKAGLNEIHLIGSNFKKVTTTVAQTYENVIAFKNTYKLNKDINATVLIKGSRGMALEHILTTL